MPARKYGGIQSIYSTVCWTHWQVFSWVVRAAVTKRDRFSWILQDFDALMCSVLRANTALQEEQVLFLTFKFTNCILLNAYNAHRFFRKLYNSLQWVYDVWQSWPINNNNNNKKKNNKTQDIRLHLHRKVFKRCLWHPW